MHSCGVYMFQIVMDFKHPDGSKVPVYLPGRSLLIMTGESRYLWSHGLVSHLSIPYAFIII